MKKLCTCIKRGEKKKRKKERKKKINAKYY